MKEMLSTRKWASTLLFQPRHLEFTAISLNAPFGYDGQSATVDITEDGNVQGRIKNKDGELTHVNFTDQERVVMLKLAFMSVKTLSANPHDKSPMGTLKIARKTAVLDFIQTQIETPKKEDPSISM